MVRTGGFRRRLLDPPGTAGCGHPLRCGGGHRCSLAGRRARCCSSSGRAGHLRRSTADLCAGALHSIPLQPRRRGHCIVERVDVGRAPALRLLRTEFQNLVFGNHYLQGLIVAKGWLQRENLAVADMLQWVVLAFLRLPGAALLFRPIKGMSALNPACMRIFV